MKNKIKKNKKKKDNSETKRIRRKKNENEIIDGIYKCSECEKSYLSPQALLTHQKNKHKYLNFEKRPKGRPSKLNFKADDEEILYKRKYKTFFNEEHRKYKNENDKNNKNKSISLSVVKKELENIFNSSKYKFLFENEEICNNSFYQIISYNWEKEESESEKESLGVITSLSNSSNQVKMTNLDMIFFKYLKEVSEKTNNTYFSFIIKFIVIFRQCINILKNDLVNKEIQSDKKIYYTQRYNAESIPESCNDIFNYLEQNKFFDLNQNELFEIVQHFCYWLYEKHYSESHLTLLRK